jgi:predicted nucleotidyltransferase
LHTVGIICEYNPFHLGHWKQFQAIRAAGGDAIVCLMSGNYVQRGAPSIIDKSLRAKAAILCGADLVLELPVTAALSSAEGFAAGGVEILGTFCDKLCFGAETADDRLMSTAKALLSQDFSPALRNRLEEGLSFPAARAAALKDMGLDASVLDTPNNILAVEYCKAIISSGCNMKPMPIHRGGSYHDTYADSENPSATAVRQLMLSGDNSDRRGRCPHRPNDNYTCEQGRCGHRPLRKDFCNFIPAEAQRVLEDATLHSLAAGERAILGKLRTMTDSDFEAVPYGSEGLWRKLMHAARKESTLEEIATAVKSKRYTRSRIDRMILCAFLGITAKDLAAPPAYARVLAFNNTGREVLKNARKHGLFPNIGEKLDHPYQTIEDRAEALYGLFALDTPTAPNPKHRIFHKV